MKIFAAVVLALVIDEKRMDQLTNPLRENAEGKFDEVLSVIVEQEWEVGEVRVNTNEGMSLKLEEEPKVVVNSLKSLKVLKGKTNQGVEKLELKMKTLKTKLKEAENRNKEAEKLRKKKVDDRLEDIMFHF